MKTAICRVDNLAYFEKDVSYIYKGRVNDELIIVENMLGFDEKVNPNNFEVDGSTQKTIADEIRMFEEMKQNGSYEIIMQSLDATVKAAIKADKNIIFKSDGSVEIN